MEGGGGRGMPMLSAEKNKAENYPETLRVEKTGFAANKGKWKTATRLEWRLEVLKHNCNAYNTC